MQDRLGAFGRQGDGEGAVGIRPGRDQDRNPTTAVGEIDVDVAEVGFEALTRFVREGDERLACSLPLGAAVQADTLRTAGVAVLVVEPANDLAGGMPLFGWRVFVGREDGVDDRFERVEDRRAGRPAAGCGAAVRKLTSAECPP